MQAWGILSPQAARPIQPQTGSGNYRAASGEEHSFNWASHALCAASHGSPDTEHLFIMPVQLLAVKTGMKWPSLCDLLAFLFYRSSSPWLWLKPKSKLSLGSPKHLLCWQVLFSGKLPQYLQQRGVDVCTMERMPANFWGFAASGMFCLLNRVIFSAAELTWISTILANANFLSPSALPVQ